MPPTLSEWAQYILIAAKSEYTKLQQLSESLSEGSVRLAKSRLVGISGQSLPVLMGSRMIDVLWSDLHMRHESRSSKSDDPFYRPFRTA